MKKILLADDHPMFRTGVRALLADTGEFEVVGELSDGRAVLRFLEEGTPVDLVLLDISLPRVNGMEVLRRLRVSRPAVKVVVLSMYAESQYGPLMRSEGASAYVAKDQPPDVLLAAIRAALTGGTDRHVVSRPAPSTDVPPHRTLSPREQQVFTLVLEGTTVTEIAAELNLSVSTVSNHLAHVKSKLGAKSVAQLVDYAHRVGLLS